MNQPTQRFVTAFVEHVPHRLESGVIYVSRKYGASSHLCACGCGSETFMPIGGEGWTLTLDADAAVTLEPSIGNFRLPCRSHYYVRGGKVVWT